MALVGADGLRSRMDAFGLVSWWPSRSITGSASEAGSGTDSVTNTVAYAANRAPTAPWKHRRERSGSVAHSLVLCLFVVLDRTGATDRPAVSLLSPSVVGVASPAFSAPAVALLGRRSHPRSFVV